MTSQTVSSIFDFVPEEKRPSLPSATKTVVYPSLQAGNDGEAFQKYESPFNPVTGQFYKGKQAELLAKLGTCNQFAGFKQWLELGRVVRKGEHGLKIFMPLTAKDESGVAAGTKFMARVVFAIEQTEILQEKVGE